VCCVGPVSGFGNDFDRCGRKNAEADARLNRRLAALVVVEVAGRTCALGGRKVHSSSLSL
jgi:hypothetical protein